VTDISETSVATEMSSYNAAIIGSTGSSTSILEDRRFAGEEADCPNSEKLAWVDNGGRGDLDREVERELWPEGGCRLAMLIERESRLELAPVVDLRTREDVSGSRMVEEAGLDPTALDDMEELSGRSHGAVFCRRREAGLICDEDPEAAELRPGEEAQCVRAGADKCGSSEYARFLSCLPYSTSTSYPPSEE
jgi:hypothetical protein